MPTMGDAYWAMITEHGFVLPNVKLLRLMHREFHEGYTRLSPDGEMTQHAFDLWEDRGDGSYDVIDPRGAD